jgi:HK97 family phage portal protein
MWPFSTLVRDTAARAEVESRDGYDIDGLLARLAAPTYSGVSVTQDSAPQLPAVFKCWYINSSFISSLPVDVFKKEGKTRRDYMEPVWLRPPNAIQTLREFVAMTTVSLDSDGNAYWLKISDTAGRLAGLEVLNPQLVQPEIVELEGRNRLVFNVSENGHAKQYASNAVIHLKGLVPPGSLKGISPIEAAKQSIGIGKAAERFGANFFGSGATLSGVIESVGQLTKEQADSLKKQFTKKHGGIQNSHAIGVLSNATWKPLSVNPEEAQFLATRNYTNEEVAQMYGFPAGFFSTDGVKGYVTALSKLLRLWYLLGVNPRLVTIEDALTGLLPRGVYVKFNRYAILQMDPAEQTAFFAAGQMGEYLSIEEIRAWLDLNPKPDGTVLHSVQWQENAPPDAADTDQSDEPAQSGFFDGGDQ